MGSSGRIETRIKSMAKIILFFLLIPVSVGAWEYTTPLGITITASDKVIKQYERHWYQCTDTFYPFRPYREQYQNCSGLKWADIDWDVIDLIYESERQRFGGVPNADPTRLKIVIKKLQYSCVDEEPNSFEMSGCIDGIYYSNNGIAIHLGDDSGQGTWFGGTAVVHELEHYFRFWRGDSTWWKE